MVVLHELTEAVTSLAASLVFDFEAIIRLSPSVRVWANAAGFLINRHVDVTWCDCKQTTQYDLESSIDDSSNVGNFEDCDF